MVANEQATRDRNDARLAGAEGSIFALHCECGTEECETVIADIRRTTTARSGCSTAATSSPLDHEIADIEETLDTTPSYAIVEKHYAERPATTTAVRTGAAC